MASKTRRSALGGKPAGRLPSLADLLNCGETRLMARTINLIRKHRYSTQIAFVALLISLVTFATVKLAMPPSSYHITWMVILPLSLGIALNQREMRWIMAPVLVVASLFATTVIGNAMGGI